MKVGATNPIGIWSLVWCRADSSWRLLQNNDRKKIKTKQNNKNKQNLGVGNQVWWVCVERNQK